jgi:antitoxin ParD1/3/4
MTITLPPALDALVVKKMATGLYDDAAEVVRDALRQMEARESALSWLKEEGTRGFEELDCGDYVELDRAGFMNHFRARRQVA